MPQEQEKAPRWRRVVASECGPLGLLSQFPKAPACYAVFLDGELSYVGSTEQLRARITAHRLRGHAYMDAAWTPWGLFRHVEIRYSLSRRRGDWLMREYRLITRLNPPLNRRTTDRGSRRSDLRVAVRLDGEQRAC